MTIQDECELSFYKKLADISSHKNVYLVQDMRTKQVFVRKDLKNYNKQIYHFLLGERLPGVPKVYRCFESDDTISTIEEYIPGINLNEYVQKYGYLNQVDATQLGVFLCYTLDNFHRQNPPIIHRDIKPSNIIRKESGEYCLVDFDAAKKVDYRKNEDTVVIGTQGFAAPEQYGYGQSDARTDIYSIGATLNYLTCRLYPKDRVVSGRLGEVIGKCCEIDPKSRYRNVSELRAALVNTMRPTKQKKGKKTLLFVMLIVVVAGALVFVGAKRTSFDGKSDSTSSETDEKDLEAEDETLSNNFYNFDYEGVRYKIPEYFSDGGEATGYNGERFYPDVEKNYSYIAQLFIHIDDAGDIAEGSIGDDRARESYIKGGFSSLDNPSLLSVEDASMAGLDGFKYNFTFYFDGKQYNAVGYVFHDTERKVFDVIIYSEPQGYEITHFEDVQNVVDGAIKL